MAETITGPEEELAICHGIIGHPREPKFLAIRHAQGWAPPTLKFPPGPVDYRAGMINEGMLNKYGLRTRVVRPLVSVHDYHCLEMELVGKGGTRRLDAVWVGAEEYERFRTPNRGDIDPFETWLRERGQEQPSERRPPWHFPGWFDAATHWIHFQLDRLQLQVTGSVEQFRVGWHVTCLLRVPTSGGDMYFKASYRRPPAEAALTAALASAFPWAVPAPLAVEDERNWLLYPDFRADHGRPSGFAACAPWAATLARLQLESAESLRRWESLGCPDEGLDWLERFAAAHERLEPWLRSGQGALDETTLKRFVQRVDARRGALERLAAAGLPATLVHPDFRNDNLVTHGTDAQLIDWTDTVTGHPFFSLNAMLPLRGDDPDAPIPEDAEPLVSAYLEPFAAHGDAGGLREALLTARSLFRLWNLSRVVGRLEWLETDSPAWRVQVVRLQRAARALAAGVA